MQFTDTSIETSLAIFILGIDSRVWDADFLFVGMYVWMRALFRFLRLGLRRRRAPFVFNIYLEDSFHRSPLEGFYLFKDGRPVVHIITIARMFHPIVMNNIRKWKRTTTINTYFGGASSMLRLKRGSQLLCQRSWTRRCLCYGEEKKTKQFMGAFDLFNSWSRNTHRLDQAAASRCRRKDYLSKVRVNERTNKERKEESKKLVLYTNFVANSNAKRKSKMLALCAYLKVLVVKRV